MDFSGLSEKPNTNSQTSLYLKLSKLRSRKIHFRKITTKIQFRRRKIHKKQPLDFSGLSEKPNTNSQQTSLYLNLSKIRLRKYTSEEEKYTSEKYTIMAIGYLRIVGEAQHKFSTN